MIKREVECEWILLLEEIKVRKPKDEEAKEKPLKNTCQKLGAGLFKRACQTIEFLKKQFGPWKPPKKTNRR